MLIATWNVNSIRSRLEQIEEWLSFSKPDLLCLKEPKVENKSFPSNFFEAKGYQVFYSGQKAYNGVAFISNQPLEDVKIGFSSELKDDLEAEKLSEQKRIISCLINGVRVVNVYVPNGSSLNSDKYIYKIKWLNCLAKYLKQQELRNEPLCLLGDFNIALKDKDIHTPNKLSGGIMASNEERAALKTVLSERLEDVFRIFESGENYWTWWNYRHSSWERDRGWRIDHIYLCEELLSNANSCVIDKKVRGNVQPSDHVPVMVDINWPPEENDENDQFFL